MNDSVDDDTTNLIPIFRKARDSVKITEIYFHHYFERISWNQYSELHRELFSRKKIPRESKFLIFPHSARENPFMSTFCDAVPRRGTILCMLFDNTWKLDQFSQICLGQWSTSTVASFFVNLGFSVFLFFFGNGAGKNVPFSLWFDHYSCSLVNCTTRCSIRKQKCTEKICSFEKKTIFF